MLCNQPVAVTDHCDPDPCVNGTCVNQADGFSCDCRVGFGGATCETPIVVEDHCDPDPCVNGLCLNQNDGYECDCDFGWSGATCAEASDPCDPDPCVHGSCAPTADAFVCDCDPGWAGPRCNGEVPPNACDPNPCANGTCVGDVAGPTCECDAGWIGAACDVAIDDPCDPNPCVNGACSVSAGGDAECACFQGWEGAACDSEIEGAVTNPVLHINNCSIELLAPGGWTDNGDGTYTTNGSVGFNLGDRVLDMVGPSLTFDTNERTFSGTLTQLPWPGFDFLGGSDLLFGPSVVSDAGVMTGAEVRQLIQPREVPLPDDLEVIAFLMNLDTPSFTLPGSTTTVGRDETNAVGFYFDPCDPLSFFSMAGDLSPPAGPLKVYATGGSIHQNLYNQSGVELWRGDTDVGEPVTSTMYATGGMYVGGEFSLDEFGVPIAFDGTFLIDVDPDRNGTIDPRILGGLLAADPFTGTVPASATDFSILGNGSVVPAIPLVGELLAFLSDGELSLTLGDGSMLIDRSNSGGLYFRGTNDRNPFEGSAIEPFFPQGQTFDTMGYYRDIDDWGLYYGSRIHFFAGLAEAEAAVSLVVDEDPELAILTEVDLGTIDFVPGVTIPLGSVPLRFTVELTTGRTCGETGYQGPDFECTIGVCVGQDEFEFYPSCAFPSGYPCVDDGMCTSDSCTGFVPDAACDDGCSLTRDACEFGCDTTRDGCSGACTVTEATCTGVCTAATSACNAGCDATDATCSGACTATGETCRFGCNTTEGACDTACTAAEATCTGTCNTTQSACEGTCGATGNTCRGACNATQATCSTGCSATLGACNTACDVAQTTCDAGCWAGTGTCDATRSTCRAGCAVACTNPCSVWGGSCWTCDRGACYDSCDAARDNCYAAIVNPCRSACANTRNSCRSTCTNTYNGCNSTCTSTGNGCRTPCNNAESSCNSVCDSVGDGCRGGCDDVLANCGSTCAATGNTCRSTCNSAQSNCQGGCDTATTDCRSTCSQAEVDCVGPCQTAGSACHSGCDTAFGDCTTPCGAAYDGCVGGCELVGTCD